MGYNQLLSCQFYIACIYLFNIKWEKKDVEIKKSNL